MSESRVLRVSVSDGLVGQLRELDDVWSFEYDEAWLRNPLAFNLSPGFPRDTAVHTNGSSVRPVQWYFDNLLPEELLRVVLAKESKIDESDAFGLLAHFGAESAGTFVLQMPGAPAASRAYGR